MSFSLQHGALSGWQRSGCRRAIAASPHSHALEVEDFLKTPWTYTGAPENRHSGLVLFNLEPQYAET